MSDSNRVQIEVFAFVDEYLPQLIEDVRKGMTSQPKFLLPKYFYDDIGSNLFEQITLLPEYYPTRTEARLIQDLSETLLTTLQPTEILELGAGSSTKTLVLLDKWGTVPGEKTYIPFDVNLSMIEGTSKQLITEYPWLSVHGIVGDFERHLQNIPESHGNRLILFLGSTIGNFAPEERINFLREIKSSLKKNDRFLMGLDLVKDVREIEEAYNDSAGVTESFNKNILKVINDNLQANFRPEYFQHRAFFNANESRIEMHLVANIGQQVLIRKLNLLVTFQENETIWTESSYKFTYKDVIEMLEASGMRLIEWYQDKEKKFGLALAGVSS